MTTTYGYCYFTVRVVDDEAPFYISFNLVLRWFKFWILFIYIYIVAFLLNLWWILVSLLRTLVEFDGFKVLSFKRPVWDGLLDDNKLFYDYFNVSRHFLPNFKVDCLLGNYFLLFVTVGSSMLELVATKRDEKWSDYVADVLWHEQHRVDSSNYLIFT